MLPAMCSDACEVVAPPFLFLFPLPPLSLFLPLPPSPGRIFHPMPAGGDEEGRTWNTNHEVAHGCDTEIAFRLDEPQCSWNEPVNSISYRKRACPSDLLVASAITTGKKFCSSPEFTTRRVSRSVNATLPVNALCHEAGAIPR